MKKCIVFGKGNIGSALIKVLKEHDIEPVYIVGASGVFDAELRKIAEAKEWQYFANKAAIDIAFICIPTDTDGKKALEYSLYFLKKGKPVITCEKASIANHWNVLKEFKHIFKYTASVGGGTQMLRETSKYAPDDIREIKGVINGTLNYIGWSLSNGKKVSETVKEVLEKGYAEPGSNSLEEIINAELNDVLLKTIIIANHSGIFDKTISKEEVRIIRPESFSVDMKRCVVYIARDNIEIGSMEDSKSAWLPEGVLNVLYINGERKAFGPGAGADATVSAMISDLDDIFQ